MLGLKNKVLFLGFRADPEQIYAASDAIVHCSTKPEPFGRDIIEAMACGKPVISTDLGAPKEIITEQAGILISPNNSNVLAENIMSLLDDSKRRERLGANARKIAESAFSIKKIVNEIENIL